MNLWSFQEWWIMFETSRSIGNNDEVGKDDIVPDQRRSNEDHEWTHHHYHIHSTPRFAGIRSQVLWRCNYNYCTVSYYGLFQVARNELLGTITQILVLFVPVAVLFSLFVVHRSDLFRPRASLDHHVVFSLWWDRGPKQKCERVLWVSQRHHNFIHFAWADCRLSLARVRNSAGIPQNWGFIRVASHLLHDTTDEKEIDGSHKQDRSRVLLSQVNIVNRFTAFCLKVTHMRQPTPRNKGSAPRNKGKRSKFSILILISWQQVYKMVLMNEQNWEKDPSQWIFVCW